MGVARYDAYAVLGVSHEASDEDIRQAYLALALRLHPDKAVIRGESPQKATELFQELQAAYETLSPGNRQHHDRTLSAGLDLGRTELMAACEAGDAAKVRSLLAAGTDVHAADATRRTALLFAASAASVEVLASLIQHSADVEARNCAGHSAVMFAVGAGLKISSPDGPERAKMHLNAVRLLLDEGAPVNAATSYGLTALMLASASGRAEMVELLLERGADVLAQSDIGLTALVMAADRGFEEVVRTLLRAGAAVNGRYGPGRTALMGAAAQAHTSTVRALLEGRADPHVVAKDGRTALCYALQAELQDGLVCPVKGPMVLKPEMEATVKVLLDFGAVPLQKVDATEHVEPTRQERTQTSTQASDPGGCCFAWLCKLSP